MSWYLFAAVMAIMLILLIWPWYCRLHKQHARGHCMLANGSLWRASETSYGNSFPSTFPEVLLAHASLDDWAIVAKHANTDELERQYKCDARDNYAESSTSPVEFIMATVCKICAGPIEPPDQHYHCIACLGLAHAETALDESDCGHCADRALGLPRYCSQIFHCRQHAAGGPPLSWCRESRLAMPPNPTVAPFPSFLPRGLIPPPG